MRITLLLNSALCKFSLFPFLFVLSFLKRTTYILFMVRLNYFPFMMVTFLLSGIPGSTVQGRNIATESSYCSSTQFSVEFHFFSYVCWAKPFQFMKDILLRWAYRLLTGALHLPLRYFLLLLVPIYSCRSI
jgi:hypothetical protein